VVSLAAEEKDRVKAAIESAEKLCAGEIRVLVVARSTRPDWRVGLAAALAVAALVHLVVRRAAWGYPAPVHELAAAASGLLAGAVAAELAGRAAKARAVRRRAEREFVRLGIARTTGRTGVLIMLSAAERRAVLLADQAIHERVDEGTWDAVVGRLTAAIREGRPADGLVVAVGEVGRALAQHFPRTAPGANELPDDVEEIR
jgi:putative membrane protein